MVQSAHAKEDAYRVVTYDESEVFDIIKDNRQNQISKEYTCKACKIIDSHKDVSYVEEEKFQENLSKYIENAYEKSRTDCYGYDIQDGLMGYTLEHHSTMSANHQIFLNSVVTCGRSGY